ncbi:MAG TPA: SprT family zinc-dependent metalloprotease [Blastocatellia bacterium]
MKAEGSTESRICSVAFGQHTIEFRLKYARRKTLGISVCPDLSVEVTAPVGRTIEEITPRVRKRAAWILRQQEYFRAFLPPTPPRRYVSGETHRYLGRQYRLKVRQGRRESVKLNGGFIEITARNKSDSGRVRELLDGWFLAHARIRFAISLERCLERVRSFGAVFPKIQIRKMEKRWGSCRRGGTIYLNPNLIKAPSYCIEYVVTHELCHLKYSDHGRRFRDMLSSVMPDWEWRKARLEKIGSEL